MRPSRCIDHHCVPSHAAMDTIQTEQVSGTHQLKRYTTRNKRPPTSSHPTPNMSAPFTPPPLPVPPAPPSACPAHALPPWSSTTAHHHSPLTPPTVPTPGSLSSLMSSPVASLRSCSTPVCGKAAERERERESAECTCACACLGRGCGCGRRREGRRTARSRPRPLAPPQQAAQCQRPCMHASDACGCDMRKRRRAAPAPAVARHQALPPPPWRCTCTCTCPPPPQKQKRTNMYVRACAYACSTYHVPQVACDQLVAGHGRTPLEHVTLVLHAGTRIATHGVSGIRVLGFQGTPLAPPLELPTPCPPL